MLTDKKKRFAEEYLKDCNAARAAVRAGYSDATAVQQGCRLMKDPGITEYLAKLMGEVHNKDIADIGEILTALTEIARNGEKEDARIRALELLGKRYGAWKDNVTVSGGTSPVKICIDVPRDEDLKDD